MLQLTATAAELIRELQTMRGAGTEMLRVSSDGESPGAGVKLGFVSAADDGDHIGESEGVFICVAADVAAALADKVIDVSDDDHRRGLVLRAA